MNPMGSHAPSLGAKLTASAEVPPNPSTGSGTLEARYNTDTQVLKWKVTYTGLTGPVTAAHFHGPAAPGTNTGVVVPFSGPLASPIEGEAKLSAIQASDLLAGKWYVNLHTAAYPGGEIRGQVTANN
nr:CHRD domain-containing protein [Piscinibacter gummiphilus]